MSEPAKRYYKTFSDNMHLQSENARLKAEVERLDTLCKQVMAQHSDISCENIMLRKAGDALAEAVGDPTVDWPPREAAWNSAKEGKGQS
jgi:hypothetical protein